MASLQISGRLSQSTWVRPTQPASPQPESTTEDAIRQERYETARQITDEVIAELKPSKWIELNIEDYAFNKACDQLNWTKPRDPEDIKKSTLIIARHYMQKFPMLPETGLFWRSHASYGVQPDELDHDDENAVKYLYEKGGKALYNLPEAQRFAGMWMPCAPGTGKTNVLNGLIYRSLPDVWEGRSSILIMDSKEHPTERSHRAMEIVSIPPQY
jgi:hypothetical protein